MLSSSPSKAASPSPWPSRADEVELRVRDTGVGIPAKELSRLVRPLSSHREHSQPHPRRQWHRPWRWCRNWSNFTADWCASKANLEKAARSSSACLSEVLTCPRTELEEIAPWPLLPSVPLPTSRKLCAGSPTPAKPLPEEILPATRTASRSLPSAVGDIKAADDASSHPRR